MCKVKLQHNNKQKGCKFLLVTGNGQDLLGIPEIDMLYIITINVNTINTQKLTEPLNAVQIQLFTRIQGMGSTTQI